METTNNSQLWYYVTDNQSHGPVNVDELRKLLLQKKILSTTLICPVGASEWKEAKTWNALFEKPTVRTQINPASSAPPANTEVISEPPAAPSVTRLPVAEPVVSQKVSLGLITNSNRFALALWLFVIATSFMYLFLFAQYFFNTGNPFWLLLDESKRDTNQPLLWVLLILQLGFTINLTRHFQPDQWRWSGMAIIVISFFGILGSLAVAIEASRRVYRDRVRTRWYAYGFICLAFFSLGSLPLIVPAIYAAKDAARDAATKKQASDPTKASTNPNPTPKLPVRSDFFDGHFSMELPSDWMAIPETSFKPGTMAYSNASKDCCIFAFQDSIPHTKLVDIVERVDQVHLPGAKALKEPLPSWQQKNLGNKSALFREYTVTITSVANFHTLQSFIVDQSPTFTHVVFLLPTTPNVEQRAEVEKILNSITFQ